MTRIDRLSLLRAKCAELKGGQAEVARRLGCSSSAINMVLKEKYPNPDAILQKVEEQFGQSSVNCPVMGDIPLKKCAENRNRPLIATNPLQVKIWRACKECEHGNGGKQ